MFEKQAAILFVNHQRIGMQKAPTYDRPPKNYSSREPILLSSVRVHVLELLYLAVMKAWAFHCTQIHLCDIVLFAVNTNKYHK